ncbi:murein L,D-transpeptidase catalytic domain family protein [Sphingomonas glaciei]|uniref:Murein L,D-transpeptidase catalytic domain family protein n=1 Tax=Sphingomonas glaciei TaxID=2938948 RepID=A0ABY5MTL0_9SPHN|nr:murein L,D-transpeptidase catalytic domain family protein [Sphingomonas glaciei]UUR07106.1 murein L,D-transpeptidase catalytic domain family protein [Sphingomonas glaciei]
MTINRRDMLRHLGLGGGAVLLSGAALAADLPGLLAGPKPLIGEPLMPVAPVAPIATVSSSPVGPIGVDPQLFARARAALERHRTTLRHTDRIGIADFSSPSRDPRFHVVDMATGQVTSHRVAHGRGSDRGHTGFLEHFSNDFGSNATSNGAYSTADFYHGKYGLSMRLNGLDWSNNNALGRAIVAHQAWYAEPDMIGIHGKLGRSEGCFAFGRDSHFEVMRTLGDGRMIYADKLA